jgi:DNA repair protein RadA/Sms
VPTGRGGASYRCAECGWQAVKWVGRCGECQAWGSVELVGVPRPRGLGAGPVTEPAQPITAVEAGSAVTRSTGIGELDRVLGGGIVPGAVLLLAGEPGVGKSTLLLEMAARTARAGHRTLYVTAEESTAQVRLRAERVAAMAPELYLAAETDLGAVLGHVAALRPELLVVDSVQTVGIAELDSAAGGVTQVREVAGALIRTSKAQTMATVLVGHVTKDGSVAGPRTLEHMVDVVLAFEGEPHSRLRLLRAAKNRYGPADEVGCFDIHESGISELPDPSGLFLSHGTGPAVGTSVTVTLEGRRPLLCEVQALVGAAGATGRRATTGLDNARVAMLLAVLERRGGLRLAAADVYAATVGGVRLADPASDLAVALAVASSASDLPLPRGTVVVGEVGLAGEVRRVPGVDRRLAEAARLGFTHALVPPDADRAPTGLRVIEVADVGAAIAALRVGQPALDSV